MVSLASMERATGVIAPAVGGSLKRKQIDSADVDSPLPSSQYKRRRVTFDPSVDVHILPDANEKSLELVVEEVRRALEKHADKLHPDNGPYDEIRSLLLAKPTSAGAPLTSLLYKYIVALSNHVPLLNHECSGMVHAIVDSYWVARNEQYVRSYRHLLSSLLSVHPGYTSSVLTMLVSMLATSPSPAIRQQDDPAVPRPWLESRIHDCLRYLLRQNPMMSTMLGPILTSVFPSSSDTTKAHTQYIGNILKVAGYCPELKGSITSLIMDKLVKIDAQIQVDLEEFEDDIEDLLEDDAADDDDEDSDEDSDSSTETLDPEERRAKEVKESILKLDAVMDLLFSHYDSVFAKGDLFDMDETFESLLSQFASIILPTHRSRHAQFLLFHFSQLSNDFMERYAGCCSHLAFEKGQPRIFQVASSAYLASYIARGAHVSGAVVRDVFDLLCHRLESLRAEQESLCKIPDLSRFGTYYAIAQALIYTFCFRWRDLIVTKDGNPPTDEEVMYHEGDFRWHNDIQDILRRNIFSKLNPLKICAPDIVSQFARMAHHLRFLYVFPLLETNKRIRLARNMGGSYMEGVAARETALSMKMGEQSFLLDAYFPFDPYLLPRSRRWIEQDYVEWKPVPGMEPVQELDDEEDNEDDEDDDNASDSESSSDDTADDDEEEQEEQPEVAESTASDPSI
ncbi:RNA polymerase I-specific transcription initiation factor RRN3 [Aaosphaeria arxii CBS 175.79]|uniref:RNA polymerase I-specific transcription initiation factor RRN3 n=1 Tax=Aaosphaeria arxii CBS 175.79 TaxID=1450172 RepID=A0A6A5XLZ9_9PLEO|nr:RNA polymerase I-specific transcription initiation factor RRN3 [Aaosphaeria arxii CBS 175.79]KAF2013354.1 RNA polymerase I-specific transcription initiation factor RRN3 [Aaosphaeria arxii CBS 175.79]